MPINVNPPTLNTIPDKIIRDDELRDFYLQNQEILYKLWLRTGGGTDLVEPANEFSPNVAARIIDIELRLGSGDPFTWDETGFSFDSTRITFDRTETG